MVTAPSNQPPQFQTPLPKVTRPPSQPAVETGGGAGKILAVVVVFVLAIVLIFGGSLILAAMTDYKVIPLPEQYREPADNIAAFLPLPKSPEFLLRVGSRRLIKEGSLKADLEVDVSSQDFSAKFGGSMPIVMNQEQKAAEIIFFVDIQTQEVFKIKGDWRLINDKNYFRLTEVPEIPFIDLSEFKDKWYFMETEAEGVDRQGLTEEQQKALAKLMTDFYSKVELEKEGQVACAGGSCTKVVAQVQPEDIAWLLDQVSQIMQEKTMDSLAHERFKESFDGPVEAIFLIGNKDVLLYEIGMKMSLKMTGVPLPTQGMMPEGMNLMGGKQESLEVNFKASFSQFGQKFEVVEPEEAVDIKTLNFGQMFSLDQEKMEQQQKMMQEMMKEMEKQGLKPEELPEKSPVMSPGAWPSMPPGLLPEGMSLPSIPPME